MSPISIETALRDLELEDIPKFNLHFTAQMRYIRRIHEHGDWVTGDQQYGYIGYYSAPNNTRKLSM